MITVKDGNQEYRACIYKDKLIVFHSRTSIKEYHISQLKRNEQGEYII